MVSFTEAFLLLAREGGANILNTLYTELNPPRSRRSWFGVTNSSENLQPIICNQWAILRQGGLGCSLGPRTLIHIYFFHFCSPPSLSYICIYTCQCDIWIVFWLPFSWFRKRTFADLSFRSIRQSTYINNLQWIPGRASWLKGGLAPYKRPGPRIT